MRSLATLTGVFTTFPDCRVVSITQMFVEAAHAFPAPQQKWPAEVTHCLASWTQPRARHSRVTKHTNKMHDSSWAQGGLGDSSALWGKRVWKFSLLDCRLYKEFGNVFKCFRHHFAQILASWVALTCWPARLWRGEVVFITQKNQKHKKQKHRARSMI